MSLRGAVRLDAAALLDGCVVGAVAADDDASEADWLRARDRQPVPRAGRVGGSAGDGSVVAKCFVTYALEPYRPCSSPVQRATRIVRRGWRLAARRIRTASITAAQPAPLSVAPVPECQLSRWAPSITISSFRSPPGISAIVLYAIWSSS